MAHIVLSGGMQSRVRTDLPPNVRTLQIEADGDSWKGLIKPKIRLVGRWLEQAGFKPGHRVQVTCVAPGLIELRSPHTSNLSEPTPPVAAQPDEPF